MSQNTLTSLVVNVPYAKQLGLPQSYYRYRSCNQNFPNRTQTSVTGFTPADQYQKQQIIQKTVRVDGSLYTANLGPLTAYKQPYSNPQTGSYGVCWNQMSDRPVPSVQNMTVPTGYSTSMNRQHTSVTSSKPGCQTPGGIGCDIKHNSYDRYLNRLKGKAPLRRGIVPPNFGKPIPFNQAYPVYGGKTTKTSIVSGCDCPQENILNQDTVLYYDPLWQPYPNPPSGFSVGSYVYAIETGTNYYSKALVTDVNNGVYTVQFSDGTIQIFSNANDLLYYFPCNCGPDSKSILFNNSIYDNSSGEFDLSCTVPISLFVNAV